VLGTLIAVPVIIIQLLIGKILMLFGQLPELAQITQQYFMIYAIAMPAFLWSVACQQVLLAVNQQRFVLFVSIASLVVAVIAAYGFIYGYFGLPRLGVRGLALASVVQAWFGLTCCLAFFYFNKRFKRYELFVWHIPKTFHILKKLFSVGWPISMQAAGDLLFFFVVTLFVGLLGETALGARQIVVQFFLLLVIPIFAISQAGTILVGQARGSRQYEDVRRYGNMVVLIGLGFAVVILLAFVFFPKSLVGLYLSGDTGSHAALEHLAIIVLILTGFRLCFDASMEILMGSLRGLYDTKYPMIATLLVTWLVGLPLVYLFGFVFHWGLIGVTFGGIVMNIVGTAVLWVRWHRKSGQDARF